MAKPQIVEPGEDESAESKREMGIQYVKINLSGDVEKEINVDQFNIQTRYLDQNAHYKKTVMDIKPPAKGEANKIIASKVYSPTTFQAKEILEKAIEQKKPVLIDYYSQMADSSTRIRIEPTKVEKQADGWMVFANAKEQNTVFDLNNIQSIEFSNNN